MARIFFLLFLLQACSTHLPPRPSPADLEVSHIYEHVYNNPQDHFCFEFELTKAQAQAYFYDAIFIHISQIHYDYPWLPCYVRGRGTYHGSHCEWEIRAGGLGAILCNGKNLFVGRKKAS